MIWRHVAVSVAGTSHELCNSPCQDASCAEQFGEDGEIVVLALSDGAGSARHSEVASKIIVEKWIDEFRRHFTKNPEPLRIVDEYQKEDCLAALEAIRDSLAYLAHSSECSLDEYAATVLCAVVTQDCGFVAQIGDGAWVACIGEVMGAVTIPAEGEYVGQTTFLTSRNWRDGLQFVRLSSKPQWLVGFTDGMQRLALDALGVHPSPAFFAPLVEGIIQTGEKASSALQDFLKSDRVCSRTDDDKSFCFLIDGRL